MARAASSALIVLLLASSAAAKDWTVTPSSTPSLAQAFAGYNGQIKAGDTVLVQAGTYPGHFIETVSSVTFKGIGLPKIDGNWPWVGDIPQAMLTTWGSDITIQGFEITDSATDSRIWTRPPGDENSRRRHGVFTYGPRTKLIDNIIHDGLSGLGAWDQCVDCEYSGNILYNNGFQAPDRGVGHGIYTQNTTGTKTFRTDATFNNFGYGIQQYGSENAHQDHYLWDQLLTWNQTALFGGHTPLVDLTVRNSHFYQSTLQLGYDSPDNSGIQILNNVFRSMLSLSLSKAVTVAGNILTNPLGPYLVTIRLSGTGNVPSDYTFSRNQEYQPVQGPTDVGQFAFLPGPLLVSPMNCGYWWFNRQSPGYGYCGTPQAWQNDLRWDLDSTWHPESKPSGVNVVSLSDPYDAGRHTVVVENWDLLPSVTLDVSGYGWSAGKSYKVRAVQDYFVDVHTVTYQGGTIALSMQNHTVAKPYGYPQTLGPDTFPGFGVFVIETVLPIKPPCHKPHWWSHCA